MPWSALAAVGASAAGAAVSGAMSPGVSGGGANYYTPTGLGTADQTWQGLLSDISGIYSQKGLDQYGLESLTNGINMNSAYGPGYQNAANAAGTGYTNAGTALTGLGNSDLATQQQLLGYGQQVMNMGLDPNNAAYNLALNNLTQQTGATNSMYGLGSSAAGAGVQNQALSNFGINWNTQQLQNAEGALSAYGNIANVAGNYGSQGASALTQAPQYTLYGGQVPYNTAQTIAAVPGQLGSTYGSYLNSNVYGPAESIQQGIIPYLNYGSGAEQTPYTTAAQGAGALGSSVSQGISGLGNAYQNAGSWGNLLNGTTGSFGGGDFSGAFTSSPYYSGGGNSYGFTLQ